MVFTSNDQFVFPYQQVKRFIFLIRHNNDAIILVLQSEKF